MTLQRRCCYVVCLLGTQEMPQSRIKISRGIEGRDEEKIVAEQPSVMKEQVHDYGKCPKISYTKVSDKMAYANSVDPDQTALKGAV